MSWKNILKAEDGFDDVVKYMGRWTDIMVSTPPKEKGESYDLWRALAISQIVDFIRKQPKDVPFTTDEVKEIEIILGMVTKSGGPLTPQEKKAMKWTEFNEMSYDLWRKMDESESTLKSTFLTTPEIEEDIDWADTKPSTLLTRLTSQLDKVRNEIEELDIHNRFREGLFDMDRMKDYQRLNRREARLLERIGREASK